MIMYRIRKRQAECIGHVTRKRKLDHLITTGKIERKEADASNIIDGIAVYG